MSYVITFDIWQSLNYEQLYIPTHSTNFHIRNWHTVTYGFDFIFVSEWKISCIEIYYTLINDPLGQTIVPTDSDAENLCEYSDHINVLQLLLQNYCSTYVIILSFTYDKWSLYYRERKKLGPDKQK